MYVLTLYFYLSIHAYTHTHTHTQILLTKKKLYNSTLWNFVPNKKYLGLKTNKQTPQTNQNLVCR